MTFGTVVQFAILVRLLRPWPCRIECLRAARKIDVEEVGLGFSGFNPENPWAIDTRARVP